MSIDLFQYFGSGTLVCKSSSTLDEGKTVEVTNGKIATIYCHMSKLSVKVGDNVKSGTKIGEVGSTGLSTGPHLHFEIVYSGTKIDPETVFVQPGRICADGFRAAEGCHDPDLLCPPRPAHVPQS